ncbi:MAG: polymer-forming cytoskeletal protein, partial [Desulfobacteraceae bacterium]|nr:polymer-forming cytoskeletal protein [Desulfobacteraceae bacterium]
MNKKNLSIIDKELTIEGSISSTGKLIIKGKVRGEIKGDVIVIAEDGEVESNSAIVASMTVGGKF